MEPGTALLVAVAATVVFVVVVILMLFRFRKANSGKCPPATQGRIFEIRRPPE
jgi:hypothetical protein